MKTKNEKEIICTYQTLINRLKERVIKTERRILDNKISDAIKKRKRGMEWNTNYHHQGWTTKIYQRKGYKLSKEISSQYYVEWMNCYHSTYGTGSSHKQKYNQTYYVRQRDTKSIGICILQWTTWFKSHVNGTIGMRRTNPQKPWT